MTATPSVDREALRRKSAPLLLCERARALPDAVAFRCKHLGLYRERNWRDYAALVARTARAFAELGLARGERVAIMGDACEEWLICDLAAQSLGAIVYGIYPTASAAEVGVPAARRRRGDVHRGEPGIRRQDSVVCRRPERIEMDRRARRFRDVRLRASQASKLRCVARAGRAARPCMAGAAGGTARPRRARLHRLYVGHHRPSQGRAGRPRQASRRHREPGRALSDARAKSRTARWPTCRSAMCSVATSR